MKLNVGDLVMSSMHGLEMDLQLGTMLYKSFSSRIGMIKDKKRLQKINKADPQWIYEAEWYYEDGSITSGIYYSNSKKLSEYRYAYIALQKNYRKQYEL